MAFVRLDKLPGKLFVPDRNDRAAAKHACPDCEACQCCSPARCAACRDREALQTAKCRPPRDGASPTRT